MKINMDKIGEQLIKVGEDLKKRKLEKEKKRVEKGASALKACGYSVELKEIK